MYPCLALSIKAVQSYENIAFQMKCNVCRTKTGNFVVDSQLLASTENTENTTPRTGSAMVYTVNVVTGRPEPYGELQGQQDGNPIIKAKQRRRFLEELRPFTAELTTALDNLFKQYDSKSLGYVRASQMGSFLNDLLHSLPNENGLSVASVLVEVCHNQCSNLFILI